MASSTKALARAFTKRVKRSSSDANASPTRSSSTRHARGAIDRGLISLPTELISTTNVQVLTAPNIHGGLRSSSGSTTSESDSEFSTIDRSFLDRTSESSSPIQSIASTPFSSPMDDVDSFFGSKGAADVSSPDLATFMTEAPVLPVRAPSHSKKAHVELSRKLSMQRMSPPPTAISQSSVRGSAELFNTTTDLSHPFIKELAKVTEVAEEFGAVGAVADEEERDLYRRGLYKFSASEYLEEIAGLTGGVFENRLGLMANPWI